MRRVILAVALAGTASACTSVKMVQRDGCWIKRTEKVFGRVREEIGPCMRAQPAWVQDQLTRLVQECVAQADHRWQVRALEAWSKSKPYPAQPAQEEILRTCMQEARVGLVAENEELKRRVADLSSDRHALKSDAEENRTHLRESHDRIAEWLGQAAQKPAGNATAMASAQSDGKATNDNGTTLASGSTSGSGASAPALPAVPAAMTPASPPAAPAAQPSPSAPADSAAPGPIPAPAPAAEPPAAKPAPASPPVQSAAAKPTASATPKRSARTPPKEARPGAPACDVACGK